jgi:hypothetical protein
MNIQLMQAMMKTSSNLVVVGRENLLELGCQRWR